MLGRYCPCHMVANVCRLPWDQRQSIEGCQHPKESTQAQHIPLGFSVYQAAVDNNNMPHGRRTSGRAPSNSRPSPVTGVDGPHVTGINKHNHVSCTAECTSDLLLLIVAVVQARPVYMASFSSFQPHPIHTTEVAANYSQVDHSGHNNSTHLWKPRARPQSSRQHSILSHRIFVP